MSEKRILQELTGVLEQIIQTPAGRRAFLLATPMMLAACAAKGKTRYREGDNTGQKTELSVADEQKMTSEVLPKFEKEYPVWDNPAAQNFVKGVGEKLIKANQLDGNPYRYTFTVTSVPMVNAFALPAGTIYVTAPLIAMADTEAELAGVIGHEIGHVKARHTAERMDKAQKESRRGLLYGLGGALLGAGAGFGLGKLLCKPDDNVCLAKATALGAAAGAGGGLLIQKFAFMANSREDEMEADRVGFRTSVAAGYSKDHVGDFYSKLLVMEEKHRAGQMSMLTSVTDAMSTHPPSKERVKQMNQLEAEAAAQSKPLLSSKAFESIQKAAKDWTEKNPPKRG